MAENKNSTLHRAFLRTRALLVCRTRAHEHTPRAAGSTREHASEHSSEEPEK